MGWTECFQWILSKLWTEQAAGWTQAILSVAAIWFAYRQGSKARRLEREEKAAQQKVRSRALVLQLMAPIAGWRRKAETFAAESNAQLFTQMMQEGLALPLRPPNEVVDFLPEISEFFGEAGRQVEEALYLVELLARDRTALDLACRNGNANTQEEKDLIAANLIRVKSVARELEYAEALMHQAFQVDRK